jgi:hypothetical protein
MTVEHTQPISPRMQTALNELAEIIRQRYPKAEFQINRSQDDPEVVHLRTTVDVEDTEGSSTSSSIG